MHHDLVGISHLGEVLSFGTGLLALAPLLGPALGPVLRHRLRESLHRGRDRGVARVAPEAPRKLFELVLEAGDSLGMRADQLLLGGDELGELLIGRRCFLLGPSWRDEKSNNIRVI